MAPYAGPVRFAQTPCVPDGYRSTWNPFELQHRLDIDDYPRFAIHFPHAGNGRRLRRAEAPAVIVCPWLEGLRNLWQILDNDGSPTQSRTLFLSIRNSYP